MAIRPGGFFPQFFRIAFLPPALMVTDVFSLYTKGKDVVTKLNAGQASPKVFLVLP